MADCQGREGVCRASGTVVRDLTMRRSQRSRARGGRGQEQGVFLLLFVLTNARLWEDRVSLFRRVGDAGFVGIVSNTHFRGSFLCADRPLTWIQPATMHKAALCQHLCCARLWSCEQPRIVHYAWCASPSPEAFRPRVAAKKADVDLQTALVTA